MAKKSTSQPAPAPETARKPQAQSLNHVALIGRLGGRPVLRYSQTGTAYATARLAVNGRDGQTSWHNIVAFGRQAELMAQFCDKGRMIGITGTLSNRSWVDDNGERHTVDAVRINTCQFLDRPRRPIDHQAQEAAA